MNDLSVNPSPDSIDKGVPGHDSHRSLAHLDDMRFDLGKLA